MATVTTLTAEEIHRLIDDLKAGGGFGGGVLDGLTGDLGDLAEALAENQALLDELNNVILPQLQIDLANNDIALADLNENILPGLQTDLANNQAAIDQLNTTTLPGLQTDLAEAEAAVAERPRVIFSPSQPSGLGSSDRVIWYDSDDGYRGWYWDGSAWSSYQISNGAILPGGIVTSHMTANSISGDVITAETLNASKIVAGSIATDRMTANTINGDRVTANTLNAEKIVAGSIATDRMTANTISGDRITGNTLNASKIVAGSISSDRMTANTINGDRIITNTLNADKITANTIQAALVNAGAINGIVITGSKIQTDSTGARIVLNNDANSGRLDIWTGVGGENNPGSLDGILNNTNQPAIVLKSPTSPGNYGAATITLFPRASLYGGVRIGANLSVDGILYAPDCMKVGRATAPITAADTNVTTRVDFLVPFTSAALVPKIFLTAIDVPNNGYVKLTATSISRTGFTVNALRSSGSAPFDFDWVAITTID